MHVDKKLSWSEMIAGTLKSDIHAWPFLLIRTLDLEPRESVYQAGL